VTVQKPRRRSRDPSRCGWAARHSRIAWHHRGAGCDERADLATGADAEPRALYPRLPNSEVGARGILEKHAHTEKITLVDREKGESWHVHCRVIWYLPPTSSVSKITATPLS